MSQEQLQQQQQVGQRLDHDDDPRGTSAYPFAAPVTAVDDPFEELLTDAQKVRIECLNAARDLVMTVSRGGQETSVSMADLITVAVYIVDGRDPFAPAGPLSSVRSGS